MVLDERIKIMEYEDKILSALDDPTPIKKPSNWALSASLWFAEAIFVILDAGSAVGVAMITGQIYYGVIVFLAGVVPLFLYTKYYTRPLASAPQKKVALIGGAISISSVILVACFIAALNMAQGMFGDVVYLTEMGLGISLVLILGVHGFLNAYHFFADEETRENSRSDRMQARAFRRVDRIKTANIVANAARTEATRQTELEGKFSTAVIAKILAKLAEDADGDGVPDIMENHGAIPTRQRGAQSMGAMASETHTPQLETEGRPNQKPPQQ